MKNASRRTAGRKNAESPSKRTLLRMRVSADVTQVAGAAELYDFAPAMYVLLDTVGMITAVNEAGCRMLMTPRERLLGLPLRMWIGASSRREYLEHLRRCRSGDGTVETELEFRARDGGTFVARVYSRRHTAAGRVYFPTVAVDLSEYRALQEAQQAAEREREDAERERELARAAVAAKDQLIAMVSHELRNPLNPALLAAEGLASSPALSPAARELAAVVERNIRLEARLIDDLLDLSRVTRGRLNIRLQPTDVHEVLIEASNAANSAAHARSISTTLDLRATSHHVNGDPARLRQVFWNLLTNAAKFSDPGALVLVRTENQADPAGRELVRVVIRDRGIGMAPDVLQNLFTPFAQPARTGRPRSGLGLGLAIVKGIVDAHGGEVAVTSPGAGRGTTIEVRLEVVPKPDAEAGATSGVAASPPPSRPSVRRVLIVEDDLDTGTTMSRVLSDRGWQVVVVQTVTAALERLAEPWDVVLSDIGLGDGSGLEIARRLRAVSRPPRCMIALSGYGATADVGASRRAGFDDHLVKPIDVKRLLALIGDATEEEPRR